MDGNWNVLNHNKTVGHGNTSKDHVDRIEPHVSVCKNHNVANVEECPKDANND